MEQRTAMLAGVSHDLRTPLTRLKLQLAMLPESPDVEDMKTDLVEMETMLGAVIGAHAGPGTVGFFWFTDDSGPDAA